MLGRKQVDRRLGGSRGGREGGGGGEGGRRRGTMAGSDKKLAAEANPHRNHYPI